MDIHGIKNIQYNILFSLLLICNTKVLAHTTQPEQLGFHRKFQFCSSRRRKNEKKTLGVYNRIISSPYKPMPVNVE